MTDLVRVTIDVDRSVVQRALAKQHFVEIRSEVEEEAIWKAGDRERVRDLVARFHIAKGVTTPATTTTAGMLAYVDEYLAGESEGLNTYKQKLFKLINKRSLQVDRDMFAVRRNNIHRREAKACAKAEWSKAKDAFFEKICRMKGRDVDRLAFFTVSLTNTEEAYFFRSKNCDRSKLRPAWPLVRLRWLSETSWKVSVEWNKPKRAS